MTPPHSLNALILSPDPSVHGGVSTFIELMKRNLTRTHAVPLWVGSRHDQKESLPALVWRLLSVPVRTAYRVRRERIDVVHINPSLDRKSVIRDGLVLLALRCVNYRHTLVYFHGWETVLEQKIKDSAFRKIFVWLLNSAALILVLSPDFKTALIAMGVDPKKVTTTRTMFDGPSISAAQTAITHQPMRQTILFMSRFVSEKGVHELAQGFARIADAFPLADLVMAGDGPEAPALKKFAAQAHLQERIVFPGYIGGLDKFKLLLDCSIYALPTYYPEGMPVALLEAMGAGKPLLTAKTGVIPYIIHEPENGIVLDHVTADSVAAALRRLLSDPAYCRETGERNKDYAWNVFEASSVTAELETLYRKVAS